MATMKSAKKVTFKTAEQTDTVKDLTEKLTEALCVMHSTGSAIKREGTQLVVPEHMTLADAARTISQWEKQMEEAQSKRVVIAGHPNETLAAFERSITRIFGNLIGKSSVFTSFFGQMKIPGQTRTIQISHNEEITVPYGQVSIPGLPVNLIINVKSGNSVLQSVLVIDFEYLKKFEPLVTMIEKEMREEIKQNSIFKGKAVNSKFDFLNLHGFPLEKIVYSKNEEADLNAHMFRLIRSSDVARKNGLPLKRTVLLHGRYGTGKTLTALLAANICVDNGWTFLNVTPGDDISSALEFAKKYQPCLVFFEDIDQVTNGERDADLNGILNTLDGILSKSAEVMTILTTNHTDRIEKAMLRPGRIDAVIELGKLDEYSIDKMVRMYCKEMLVNGNGFNPVELLSVSEGYTPSFIAEACNRAMLYALEREQGHNGGAITHDDLKKALMGLRSQFDLMNADRTIKDNSLEGAFKGLVEKELKVFASHFESETLDSYISDRK